MSGAAYRKERGRRSRGSTRLRALRVASARFPPEQSICGAFREHTVAARPESCFWRFCHCENRVVFVARFCPAFVLISGCVFCYHSRQRANTILQRKVKLWQTNGL